MTCSLTVATTGHHSETKLSFPSMRSRSSATSLGNGVIRDTTTSTASEEAN